MKEQQKKDQEERGMYNLEYEKVPPLWQVSKSDLYLTELKMKQAEELEKQRLEEMDEDEYDALNEEQKAAIDKKRLEMKRERRKKWVLIGEHLNPPLDISINTNSITLIENKKNALSEKELRKKDLKQKQDV